MTLFSSGLLPEPSSHVKAAVVFAFFFVFCSVWTFWLLPRIWRGDRALLRALHKGSKRALGLKDSTAWSLVRPALTVVVACWMLCAIAGVHLLKEQATLRGLAETARLGDQVGKACAWLFIVFVLLSLTIALFNRPRFLAPPSMRNDQARPDFSGRGRS